MGGSITIAIRRTNGIEYVSRRWTNPLPAQLADPAFWDDGTVVDDYTKVLVNDVLFSRIQPEQYGIVLIDFQTKKVLSCNKYMSLGQFTTAFIDQDDAKHVLAMIAKGWVKRYDCFRDDDARRAQEPPLSDLAGVEIEQYHAHLRHVAGEKEPPNPEIEAITGIGGWKSLKPFKPGMVVVHYLPEGWSFYNYPEQNSGTYWEIVRAFLEELDWKTPAWTSAETRKNNKYDEEEDTVT